MKPDTYACGWASSIRILFVLRGVPEQRNGETAKQKNSETEKQQNSFLKIILYFFKDKTSEPYWRVNTILHATSISLKLVYFSDRFCQYCGFVISIREYISILKALYLYSLQIQNRPCLIFKDIYMTKMSAKMW